MPVLVGPPGTQTSGPRWWEKKHPQGQRWKTAKQVFEQIQNDDRGRQGELLRWVRLYTNRDMQGLSAADYSRIMSEAQVTLNGIKAVVDTVTSKITRIRPVPKFLPNGGPFTIQRKCKLLERWALAQLQLSSAHEESVSAFVDSAIGGTGCIKPYRKGKKICIDRVWPGNVFVDPVDAFHGRPSTLWEAYWVNRDWLLAQQKRYGFGSAAKEAIEKAHFGNEFGIPGYSGGADQVLVIEVWRLPPSEDIPGRHLIFTDGADLSDREWTHPWFPHLFHRWTPPRMGFWGQGVAENLEGLQAEMNRTIQRIAKAHRLSSTLIWWVDQATLNLVRRNSLTNEIGAIYPYAGARPPHRDASPIVPPEMYAQLNWYYHRMFELEGISQLSASASNIGRIDSGEGFRTLNDIQSERFIRPSRGYERMFRDLTVRLIALAREIDQEEEGGYEVVAERDRHTISRLKWKDIDLDEDAYQIRIFPASALPDDPGGRLAAVRDLYADGLVPRETALRMADLPDLDQEMDLALASVTSVDRDVEKILDDNVSMSPDPFADPRMVVERARAWLAKARTDEVPEGRQMKLRQYIREAAEMAERAAAELAAAQASAQQELVVPEAPVPQA